MEWLNGSLSTGATAVSLIVILLFAQLRGYVYLRPHVIERDRQAEQRLVEARADRDARIAEVRATADREVAALRLENDRLWSTVGSAEEGRKVAQEQTDALLLELKKALSVMEAIPRPP